MTGSTASGTRLKLAASIVAVIAAALLVVAILTSYAPPDDSEQLTEVDVVRAEKAVETMEETVRQVEIAASEGRRERFELTVDQDEITNYLRSNERISETLRARDLDAPKVEFQGQSIAMSCVANVRGRKVHITVHGRLVQTDEGGMVFHSDSVLLGKLPAPPSVKRKVTKAINDYFLLGTTVLPASVTEITSEDGTLIIGGVSDPDVAATNP